MDKLRQGDSFTIPVGRVTTVRIRVVRYFELKERAADLPDKLYALPALQALITFEVLK